MATRGYYEYYTLEELEEKDKDGNFFYGNEFIKEKVSIEESLKNSDDKLLSNTWTEAYKMAAYYFDQPTIDDRLNTFDKFRFNFAGLLQKTKAPNELPDLNSRKSFVSWVCKKHNEFLEANNENVRMDCNVEKLVKNYGPNYDNVKKFLGAHQYKF
jgi:hypothetical protein